jgi:probable F420-dependent oxidoreductase
MVTAELVTAEVVNAAPVSAAERTPEFGITLQCDLDGPATVALARDAERAGFDAFWLFDSPLLWRDPYPLLTLVAVATDRLRLGTCVTNAGTRHPTTTAATLATLQELSDGRVDLGIGRGDSALRMLGRQPTSIETMEEAVGVIRDLVEGRSVVEAGRSLRLAYASGQRLPVWVAGYGPRAIAAAGRVADGLILQVGDPDLVAWFADQYRAAAAAAGRDPAGVRIQVAAPAIVGDRDAARERVRWYPDLVAHHVLELLERVHRTTLAPALTSFVDRFAGRPYSPHHDGDLSFVDADTIDRFCILGSAAHHRRRIAELVDAGATQVNLYLVSGDEAETVEAYGRDVIPAFRAATLRAGTQ